MMMHCGSSSHTIPFYSIPMPAPTPSGCLCLKRVKRIKDHPFFSCAVANSYHQTHLDVPMVLKCWWPHRQTTWSQPSRHFLSWKKSRYFGSLRSFYRHAECLRQQPRGPALLGAGPASKRDQVIQRRVPPWTEDISPRPGIPRPLFPGWAPSRWGLCPCAPRDLPCCSLCLPALLGRARLCLHSLPAGTGMSVKMHHLVMDDSHGEGEEPADLVVGIKWSMERLWIILWHYLFFLLM